MNTYDLSIAIQALQHAMLKEYGDAAPPLPPVEAASSACIAIMAELMRHGVTIEVKHERPTV
jgi:hypothetical protein